MFLSVKPLTPVDAHLVETSYQAVLSPINGVASYRLRAALDESGTSARIGLRGTAKLYGNWVVFGYYVLRRPLASLREGAEMAMPLPMASVWLLTISSSVRET